jgi:hypothetical protein
MNWIGRAARVLGARTGPAPAQGDAVPSEPANSAAKPQPKAHPYKSQPRRAFWRAVAESRHPLEIDEWYRKKFPISDSRIGTAGSCFAQHIGRELRSKRFHYVDVEPAPGIILPARHGAYGYGIYSARYGNVYTTRQLLQLLQRALGEFTPVESAWPSATGFVDPFRPTIEPQPLVSREEVQVMRQHHLGQVVKLFEGIDVFVFTLGLTEAWIDLRDGAAYPVAPGVSGGTFDPATCRFVNFAHHEVLADLEAFIARVRTINPQMRFLFTVSPVPLTATATGQHVIAATTYSKSVLRAVAGELSDRHAYVDYFPSYEIISSHVMRGQFYNADMRTVNSSGVDHVMRQFFKAHAPPASAGARPPAPDVQADADDVVCDEELLASFGG